MQDEIETDVASRNCQAEGCGRKLHARGRCRVHYYREVQRARPLPHYPPDTNKCCLTCGVEKPLADFAPRYTTRDGRANVCRKCAYLKYSAPWRKRNCRKANQTSRTWRQANPGRVAVITLRSQLKRYGITEVDYTSLLQQQRGVCAICHRPETRIDARGKVCRLAVDHDHDTGAVRGLLCTKCNSAMGQADDNPDRLLAMAIYLEKARAADSRRKD